MPERLESMVVADIMIPLSDYPHVSVDTSLRDTIDLMNHTQLIARGKKSMPRAVLVFDADEKLVGIARRRDILRGLEPKFLINHPLEYRKKLFDVKVDPNLSLLNYDKIVAGIQEQANNPVKEIMRPIKTTVEHDDHLIKVIYELVDNNISLIPVLRDETVVGIIRTVDAFRELSMLLHIEVEGEGEGEGEDEED